MQSVPLNVLEEYNLTSMTLEYRRECRQSNLLESLTSMQPSVGDAQGSDRNKCLESTHLLRMQDDKAEIIRARCEWKSKHKHGHPLLYVSIWHVSKATVFLHLFIGLFQLFCPFVSSEGFLFGLYIRNGMSCMGLCIIDKLSAFVGSNVELVEFWLSNRNHY